MLFKMFSLAEVWGWYPDGTNPCRHVKRYKEHKRERFLSLILSADNFKKNNASSS